MGIRAIQSLMGLAVVAACGGQSLHDDGTGGSAGTTSGGSGSSGSGSGGQSASGGSGGNGQAARGGSGGSATAGRGGSAGSGVGGSVIAGGAGGSSGAGSPGAGRGGASPGGSGGSGGSSTSGTGPVAGAPSDVCSLPLETGPCDAAFSRYGFNTKTERCELFSYGGCEGNENNFETFEACLASCGLANENDCPAKRPEPGASCTDIGHPCDYSGTSDCLCQPTAQYTCVEDTTDPTCAPLRKMRSPSDGACAEPPCTAEIVIISYYTCSCDAAAGWSCVVGGATGGPR